MKKLFIIICIFVCICFAITKGRAQHNISNDYNDTCAIDTIETEDTAAVDTFYRDSDFDYYNPDYDTEYKVTSVAGVEFGSPRYTVLSKLKDRFGYSYTENGNCITFPNVNIGGCDYDIADFYFSQKGLCCVQLQKHFALTSFDKAKLLRDNLAYAYGRKYKNIKSRTDKKTKIKYYVCGMMENFRYPIVIDLQKLQSKGGQYFYYVTVEYFTMDAAVNDDI